MYAVVKTGGKQYKVRPGDTLEVEKLPVNPGDTVELDRVLLLSGDDELQVGRPLVEGARVRATVLDQVKGDKITILKFKPKNRYQRKSGHRQRYTRLRIDEIVS